jgi:Holliday junction resolvase
MALTPEGRVKRVVTEKLRRDGVYYFFPVMGLYGSSGVPDIVGCYHGMFFAIECKAGYGKPTPLQAKQIKDISAAEGAVTVINEHNMGETIQWLENAYQKWLQRNPNLAQQNPKP